MEETTKSKPIDWIIFLVSTVALILLLLYASEWFWLALPFSFTYLAKSLNVL